jgi:hypothetical protein
LAVGIADGAAVVTERLGAGALGEGGEGPQVDGVGEAFVAGVAGQTARLVPEALVNGDVPP